MKTIQSQKNEMHIDFCLRVPTTRIYQAVITLMTDIFAQEISEWEQPHIWRGNGGDIQLLIR